MNIYYGKHKCPFLRREVLRREGPFPGPPRGGGEISIFCGHPVIFWGEIFLFTGKVPKFGMEKMGKVTRKQLERYCT